MAQRGNHRRSEQLPTKVVHTVKRGHFTLLGLDHSLALLAPKLLQMKFSSYDCTLAYSSINWNDWYKSVVEMQACQWQSWACHESPLHWLQGNVTLDDFRKYANGVKSFSHIKVSLVAMLHKVKVYSGNVFTVDCTHLPLTGGGA